VRHKAKTQARKQTSAKKCDAFLAQDPVFVRCGGLSLTGTQHLQRTQREFWRRTRKDGVLRAKIAKQFFANLSESEDLGQSRLLDKVF
jgi:hypothetical protein